MEGGRPVPEKVESEATPARPIQRQVLLLGGVVLLGVLIPLAIGLWLDIRLHTGPWLFLAGMVLGTVTATTGVLLLTRARYRAFSEEANSKNETRRRPSTPTPTE